MTARTAIRGQLAKRTPRLHEWISRIVWRRRNRDRAIPARALGEPTLDDILARLRGDGVCVTDAEAVFGDTGLFEAAAETAHGFYRQPREKAVAEAGSKATFLTKLAHGAFAADHPFARLALHPNALAVANGYLGLRATLRVLDLWLTVPTAGPAIQTQLWHRDADDLMNVKMFVYFTDVTAEAGPLCYAPGTHPLGIRRRLPDRDEHGRSTDEQLGAAVPPSEWIYCKGKPGTVVFADTCGYHKQVKPTADERLLLVSQYVSGTPFVPRALELTGADPESLSDDQYVAVFDALRAKHS